MMLMVMGIVMERAGDRDGHGNEWWCAVVADGVLDILARFVLQSVGDGPELGCSRDTCPPQPHQHC